MLARLRPPALLRAPRAQPLRQAARARTRTGQAGLLAALDDAISQSDAKQRLQALVEELDKGGYTAAAKCLTDDPGALVVHLRYPPRHRRRWRSTNLLEGSLGEVKRRTKVTGRFPGEQSRLSLVWAVVDHLITHETNGSASTNSTANASPRTRYQGPERATAKEVTAA